MARGARGATGWLGAAWLGLHLCSMTVALEVSVGKAPVIYAKNGTDVLLPCIFTTCIGFENAKFSWTRSVDGGNFSQIYSGTVKNKGSEPVPSDSNEELDKYVLPKFSPPKDKEYNISLLVLSADFEDSGRYNCWVKNPREKRTGEHNATITLKVVVELEKVDNTVTVIIVSVVGGVIGLLILIMVTKKLILFILKKTQEKKECLVSSSANDNTENGLAGSKAEQKSAPKA